MFRPAEAPPSAQDAIRLWHELGMAYAVAGDARGRAGKAGFVVACIAAALVLLSAPVFGTAWAGPYAAVIPVAAGLLAWGASLLRWHLRFRRGREGLSGALASLGERPDRPTAGGLGAYYDVQLVLLRSEYEYLVARRGGRATRSARLLAEAFGFAPEDGFECGPLNVSPDSEPMAGLRRRWEARLALRGPEAVPSMGLREDRAYRVFPREMTVPMELATRQAYLGISLRLAGQRYGRRGTMPEEVRRRVERDRREYAAISVRRYEPAG